MFLDPRALGYLRVIALARLNLVRFVLTLIYLQVTHYRSPEDERKMIMLTS